MEGTRGVWDRVFRRLLEGVSSGTERDFLARGVVDVGGPGFCGAVHGVVGGGPMVWGIPVLGVVRVGGDGSELRYCPALEGLI